MQSVILAAGEGVRMRPLTLERPKALVEVAGKPLLEHMLDALPAAVDEVIIVVKYKGDMIRDRFKSEFKGKKITYVEQTKGRGTGDALRLTAPLLRRGERFFVSYADDLHDKASIEKMLSHPLALLTYRVADPRQLGVVVTDASGRIIDIEEKPEYPKTDMAAIGVYLLDDRIFSYEADPHPSGEYYLTSMIQKMAKDHAIFAVPSAFWFTVTTPQDVAAAEKMLG
jgi:NDP-sugar pyrophosphorylase family protein